jgi:subtilisin family serine protease
VIFKLRILLFFISLNTLVFTSSVSSSPLVHAEIKLPTDSLVFSNFSKKITLVKKGRFYQVAGKSDKVELSDRLIVKTNLSIDPKTLRSVDHQIQAVTPLYTGHDQIYYLVKMTSQNALAGGIKSLEKSKGVSLVQPDMLQLASSSHQKLHLKIKNKPISDAQKDIIRRRLEQAEPSPYLAMLDIPSLWKTTTGKGVKVAIIDDGFNLNQPDLKHVKPIFSFDVTSRKLDALPQSARDGHGTRVADIIFAAHNNVGIDGIAPDAQFIALRQPDTWTSNTLLAFQVAKLAGADVINCSWHSDWLVQPVSDVVTDLATFGRKGKGVAVVFAAGNEGRQITPNSTEASINSAIVVGAINAQYKRMPFSNYGKSVDIWVYGGRARSALVSDKFGYFSATSLAASVVSGVSALLLSAHPEMTLSQLVQQLKQRSLPKSVVH